MKRFLFTIIILDLILNPILAEPINSQPFKVAQPNGDSIVIIQRGDEYGSWYEDDKGDIISLNNDNYWVYVSVENFLYTKMRLC